MWTTEAFGEGRLTKLPPLDGSLSYPQDANPDAFEVKVNPNMAYQVMDGFGAALSNSAAYVIYNSPRRYEILRDLFGAEGIDIRFVRLVMGASDFMAVPPYTYHDIDPNKVEYDLASFSIEKDRDFFIPIVKDILEINPNVKFMSSPWTAPAWMKNNRILNSGALVNYDTRYMESYAQYFVKYIKAYEAEGITIDSITPQNEPMHQSGSYPTMMMGWDVQRDFVKDYLGPAFKAANINTKIIVYDHNWDNLWYPLNLLNDAGVSQYASGVAFHCYGGDHEAPSTLKEQHPDTDIYFTECSGGEWDEYLESIITWNFEKLFIGQPRNWAKGVLLWNLALDENNGPMVDVKGCTNCRGVVTVRSTDGSWVREPEYYLIGHMSKFIKPGAVRIDSTMDPVKFIHSVAFRNEDDSIATVILNFSWNTTVSWVLNQEQEYYSMNDMPPASVVTLFHAPQGVPPQPTIPTLEPTQSPPPDATTPPCVCPAKDDL